MEGRSRGRIAALLLAPVFLAPLPETAEAQSAEPKEPKKARVKKPVLSKEAAEKRYQEGLELEKKGDLKGSFSAFLAAGEAGRGLPPQKPGGSHREGDSVVKRDSHPPLLRVQKAAAAGPTDPHQT